MNSETGKGLGCSLREADVRKRLLAGGLKYVGNTIGNVVERKLID